MHPGAAEKAVILRDPVKGAQWQQVAAGQRGSDVACAAELPVPGTCSTCPSRQWLTSMHNLSLLV